MDLSLTRLLFVLVVFALGVQRLVELRLSRRNARKMMAQGGREHAAGQMPWMAALHAGWLAAMLVEVLLLHRPFHPWLALPAALLLAAGQGLRYAAIRTLGARWTVRVITLPGRAPVSSGIYRHIRHPNYLGVILEILAVPLLHSAYLTAISFSVLNGLLLWRRIRAEEQALIQDNQYERVFAARTRSSP